VETLETETEQTRHRAFRTIWWLLPSVSACLLFVLLGPGFTRLRGAEAPPAPPAAPAAVVLDPALEAQGRTAVLGEAPPAALAPEPLAPEHLPPLDLEDGRDRLESAPESDDTASAQSLDCIIEPFQVVAIGSPVVGLIEKIHVERSDLVTEGQVVAELESGAEEAAAELARARAHQQGRIKALRESLELGRAKQQRAKGLYEREALSLDLLQEAETAATVARLELDQALEDRRLASLELDQAQQILKRRTVRSPVSGVVVERLMSPGEVVDENTILRIAQIDPLRVEVILPSAQFGEVRPGMKAAVVPEFPGDQVHVASVTIVDRLIDPASGTFGVRLELPNPDHEIPGGLHCQVRFLDE
jgi:RND family efflux transporter MFP subunit